VYTYVKNIIHTRLTTYSSVQDVPLNS
jgi:hypothetical protein